MKKEKRYGLPLTLDFLEDLVEETEHFETMLLTGEELSDAMTRLVQVQKTLSKIYAKWADEYRERTGR